MSYQALYRQWRPRHFSQMIGQENIVETLRHQVETGRIPHAYLFCGSRGTGKTSTAKIMARAINCEHPVHGDACDSCETCRLLNSDENLDIIEMDAASNRGIEDARGLRESVKYPPQYGKYKVYIIDEVHMLTKEAFNALLKTLEEPPAHVVFILATTEPQQLPATILSRCQRFDFGRIPARQILSRLREAADHADAEATDSALMMIAKAAEGGMRDALSILDMCIGYGQKVDDALVQNVLGTSDRSFLFRFSRALAEENASETIRMIDALMRNGKDPGTFARSVSEHLRTLLTAKCCGAEIAELFDLSDSVTEDYIQAGKDISTSRLMNMLDMFMQFEADVRYTSSPRIALENVSLKCCLRTKETDSLALNDRLADLENQLIRINSLLNTEQIRKAEIDNNTIDDFQKEKHNETPVKKTSPNDIRITKVSTDLNTETIWKEALKELQKSEPAIHGMIRMGQFDGADGTEYRWKANPGFEIIVKSLNSKDRKVKIEEALTAVSGIKSTFLALDRITENKKEEYVSDNEYVQELRNTFGEEPVSVMDELPS